MIILQQTLKDQLQNESGKKTSSPSSFFKSKWLEEQDQKKTFNHLNGAEIDQTIQERIYFKSSKASDYERFQEMNDLKRSSDFKVFSKLRSIIKPYQKLEFQKLTEELEALDCLYSIQNKKIMNHQMIRSLTQSLKQIEKHCQKIKKEINHSLKKSRLKSEMTPSEIILKDGSGGDISSSSIFEEFSIIAKQCQFLSNTDKLKTASEPSLFPDLENNEIPLDYFIITLKNLFQCVDLTLFKVTDQKSELKTFCWEGILQTPSLCFTPYSTFLKSYKRCSEKKLSFFGLSQVIKIDDFNQIREKISQF